MRNVFLDLESLPVYCIYHNLGISRAIDQVWPRIGPNTGWLCDLDESGYHFWKKVIFQMLSRIVTLPDRAENKQVSVTREMFTAPVNLAEIRPK